MPSNYKRKTTQQNWDAEAMKKAIEAVQSGEMNFSKAATMYSIPRSTLKRRVKNKNVKATDNKKLLGCCAVFTDEQEMELVNVIFEMEEKFGKLSFLDVRSLAYQLAEKKNLRHTFSRTKQIAGKDWLRGFRKRHPEVVLRNPEIPWLEKGRAIKAAKRAMMAAQNPIAPPAPIDDGTEKKKKKMTKKPSSTVKKKASSKNNTVKMESENDNSKTDHDGISEENNQNINTIEISEENTECEIKSQYRISEVPTVTNSAKDSESEVNVESRSQDNSELRSVTSSAEGSECEISVLYQSRGSVSVLPRITQSNEKRASVETTANNTTSNSIIIDILNAPSLEPSPEMDLDIISPQSPSEMTIKQKPMFGIRGGIMKKKLHCKRE